MIASSIEFQPFFHPVYSRQAQILLIKRSTLCPFRL